MDSGIVREANHFFRDELQKRWPLRYKHRRSGLWIAEFPDGSFSNFHLHEYGRTSVRDEVILRLNDVFEVSLPKGCRSFVAAHQGGVRPLEISFLAEEMGKVIPWLLDNYLKAKAVPRWLHEPYKAQINLGHPVRYYLWSEKGHEVAEKRRLQANKVRCDGLSPV
jgi:hypothetical protein